jgi:hypothetical protein
LYVRIIPRHPENLEGDHLIVMLALPNFGDLGDALGLVPFLHHALKSV